MSRMLLALPLFLIACNTTEPTQSAAPETKKASFNLKEACAKGLYYAVEDPPTSWYATLTWKDSTGAQEGTELNVSLEKGGFKLPCSYPADSGAILTIRYN